MKPRLLVLAALLCTLRATGANAPLSPAESVTLKQIDGLPTRAQIDFAVAPAAGLDRLIALTADASNDLVIQIRAIRLLPAYCTKPGEPCDVARVHDTLLAMIQGDVTELRLGATLSAQELLRLRAAIEALGATRSALPGDVDALTLDPQALLHHPSRDVRVTVVRALQGLGSCAAIGPLQMLGATEAVDQVQQAILLALQSLQTPQMCT